MRWGHCRETAPDFERLRGLPAQADAPIHDHKGAVWPLHHPPYSADDHHGGSSRMGELLDEAFERAKRWPDMVLSGHVHNYQRFSRTHKRDTIPYIVAGAGGYHRLHKLASSQSGKPVKAGTSFAKDCKLERFCDDQWGFLRLTITKQAIKGEYIAVNRDGKVTTGYDKF